MANSDEKDLMVAIQSIRWNFTENYREKLIYDFLRVLSTNSKSHFMVRLIYLINAQNVDSGKATNILKLFNDREGEDFAALASVFVGSLLTIDVNK